MYRNLAGFTTQLSGTLQTSDNVLPISDLAYDELLLELGMGDYTFLVIKDGRATEVVKISNHCGVLIIERGAESTESYAFRCGSIVRFVITATGIQTMICQMDSCKESDMEYVQFAGFSSNLIEKFFDVDTDLPIHEQHIAALRGRLTDDTYTFVKIFDGTSTEYVKIVNRGGTLLTERGFELTNPTTFPVGACVTWEITPTAVEALICQMPCCPDEGVN